MLLTAMKNRIAIVVLGVLCIGLAIALIKIKKDAADTHETDIGSIATYSNKWTVSEGKVDEQRQVIAAFEKDVETQRTTLNELTNNLTKVSGQLTQTEASLQASRDQVKKDEAKIAELESQNQALDKQATDLSASITNLTVQIADTQKKLNASEGDKAFLEKELKRLITEKAELERQFNDLAVLRAQVSKLKEELNIARRIEWIRQGLFASTDQKGAQKLMTGISTPQPVAKPHKAAYDLNVEISADGSVKVIPPSTNAPAKAK